MLKQQPLQFFFFLNSKTIGQKEINWSQNNDSFNKIIIMIPNNSTIFFFFKLLDLLYCNIWMILHVCNSRSFLSTESKYYTSLLLWVFEVNMAWLLKCYIVYYWEFLNCFTGCCLHQPYLQTGVPSSQHHLRHAVVQAGAGEGGTQPSEYIICTKYCKQ